MNSKYQTTTQFILYEHHMMMVSCELQCSDVPYIIVLELLARFQLTRRHVDGLS